MELTELTNNQRKEFREALLSAFPEITDLKMMLSDELDWKLNQIANKGNDTQIVFKLIDYAESKGKLKELLKAATKCNPGNYKLRKFANDFNVNAITKDEINNLKFILEKIEFDIVKSSYIQILPENVKLDNLDFCNPQNQNHIIEILSKHYTKASNDVPSIVKLSEDIINKIPNNPVIYQNLSNWLNKIKLKLNIKTSVDQNRINKSELSNFNLLFIVYPESEKFRLETIYIDNRSLRNLDYLATNNNEKRKGIVCSSLKEISQELDKSIKYCLKQLNDSLKIIEVYLPYQLIYTDVTNFYIKDDFNDDIAILKDFKIIVHSSDRITGEMNLKYLNEGWVNLLRIIENKPHPDIIQEKIETISRTNKFNWDNIEIKLKDKIGLKLTKPLSDSQTERQAFIKTILKGGVPFAFWIKCNPSRYRNLKQIDCYLTSEYLENNLQNLIQQVYEMRYEAYSKQRDKELGYHLGFLCDVPDEIRKIKRLQSPALKL